MKKVLLLILLGVSAFAEVKPYKVLANISHSKDNSITTGIEGQYYSKIIITDKLYGKVGAGLEAGAVVSIENKSVKSSYIAPVSSLELGYKVNEYLNTYVGINASIPVNFYYQLKKMEVKTTIAARAYIGAEYKGFSAEIGSGLAGNVRLGLGYSF